LTIKESLKTAAPASALPIAREPGLMSPPAYAPLYSPEAQAYHPASQPPSYSLPYNPEAQAYFQNIHQLYASAAAIPLPQSQLPLQPAYQSPVMADSGVRVMPLPSAPLIDAVPPVAMNVPVNQPASNEADLLGLMTPVDNKQQTQSAQNSYSKILEELQGLSLQTPQPAAVIRYPEVPARVRDDAQRNVAVATNPFALQHMNYASSAARGDDLLEARQYQSIYPPLSPGSGK
jgi:hypothetical protein